MTKIITKCFCSFMIMLLIVGNCSFQVSASEISIDRMYTTYQETNSFASEMIYKMNCYGYALRVYCLQGTLSNPYKQQPGEFADNTIPNPMESNAIVNVIALCTGPEILDFIEGRIYADFSRISSIYSGEWSITQTTVNASVPSGYRKIALTVGCDHDYHFYMRHSDGTWSHKMSSSPITNKSITSNVTITDNNIASVVTEGGYNDGVRYYLISKPAIVDYPHSYGQYNNSLVTGLQFSDRAGDDFQHSTTVALGSKECRKDYLNDKDYFRYIATANGNKTISVIPTGTTSSDFDLKLFNSQGELLSSDLSDSDPSITYYMIAGARYYIEVSEYNGELCKYTFSIAN